MVLLAVFCVGILYSSFCSSAEEVWSAVFLGEKASKLHGREAHMTQYIQLG